MIHGTERSSYDHIFDTRLNESSARTCHIRLQLNTERSIVADSDREIASERDGLIPFDFHWRGGYNGSIAVYGTQCFPFW